MSYNYVPLQAWFYVCAGGVKDATPSLASLARSLARFRLRGARSFAPAPGAPVSQASGFLLVLLDQDYQANTPPPMCARTYNIRELGNEQGLVWQEVYWKIGTSHFHTSFGHDWVACSYYRYIDSDTVHLVVSRQCSSELLSEIGIYRYPRPTKEKNNTQNITLLQPQKCHMVVALSCL